MKLSDAVKVVRGGTAKMVDNVLNREMYAEAKAAELEAIREVVYDAYDPLEYIRRGDRGGFADPDNIVIQGGAARNGRLVLKNVTPPDDRYDGSTTGKDLAELIAYGHSRYCRANGVGYDFISKSPRRRQKYMAPRDFVGKAHEIFAKEDKTAVLRKGLLRQYSGFKFGKN